MVPEPFRWDFLKQDFGVAKDALQTPVHWRRVRGVDAIATDAHFDSTNTDSVHNFDYVVVTIDGTTAPLDSPRWILFR